MTALLCLSPRLLDQSFPRSEVELQNVAIALGEIESLLETQDVQIVITKVLEEFVEAVDWSAPRPYPILSEVYKYLVQLCVAPGDRRIKIDVGDIEAYTPHPLPRGVQIGGLVELWADEVGRLSAAHRQVLSKGHCIGVVCDAAFVDATKTCDYEEGADYDRFPLVGPSEVLDLFDAYEWDVDPAVHDGQPSFVQTKRNIHLLGAIRIRPPGGGGSHYVCVFRGARSWPLDANVDPVPDRFLKELIPIAGRDIGVIKYCLLRGELPARRGRFDTRRVLD